jgi:HAE1 family hydrophobic/amphiphilic exporter-1
MLILAKAQNKRSAAEIAVELRKLVGNIIGAEYVVQDDLNNGGGKPVQIQFSGPDARKLLSIANEFMDKLRKVDGAVDVGLSEQDPKDELQIEMDRGLANTLGISVNDAAQALRVAFAGVEVGDWVDPTGETRDVSVRLQPGDRVNLENIERLPISVTGSDKMVPLEQIAKITMGKGPSQIQHYDGKRMIAVSANVQGRSAGEVTSDALKIAKAMSFPTIVRHWKWVWTDVLLQVTGRKKSGWPWQQRRFLSLLFAFLSRLCRAFPASGSGHLR